MTANSASPVKWSNAVNDTGVINCFGLPPDKNLFFWFGDPGTSMIPFFEGCFIEEKADENDTEPEKQHWELRWLKRKLKSHFAEIC